jgi:hypothetical protein
MTDIKRLKKDTAVAVDTGNELAVRLASMKPGQSIDFINEQPEKVVTLTAEDIGDRPQQLWQPGIGAGRSGPGVLYVTKLEREPAGTPGYGKTSQGPITTTFRGDTSAAESDGRVGGNDEGGIMSFGPKTKSGPTNPVPSPDGDTDAGGPIRKGAKRNG